MCLLAVAWKAHPDYALAVVANRDEFHARPSAPAAYWPDHPDIFAGRDLEAGGTWLGTTRSGRFAALTNYRDPSQFDRKRRSRGELPREFLAGGAPPLPWLETVKQRLSDYNDFNLLAGDASQLFCLESRTAAIIPLPPGIYGLSNHLLDTPWPKVLAAKRGLAAVLETLPETPPPPEAFPRHLADLSARLMGLLADPTPYPDDLLPDTGIPLARERLISAAFIRDPHYGTRSTTVLLRRADGTAWFGERRFGPEGDCTGETGIMLH